MVDWLWPMGVICAGIMGAGIGAAWYVIVREEYVRGRCDWRGRPIPPPKVPTLPSTSSVRMVGRVRPGVYDYEHDPPHDTSTS